MRALAIEDLAAALAAISPPRRTVRTIVRRSDQDRNWSQQRASCTRQETDLLLVCRGFRDAGDIDTVHRPWPCSLPSPECSSHGFGSSSRPATLVTPRSSPCDTRSRCSNARSTGPSSPTPTARSSRCSPVFDRRRLADVFLIAKPAAALGWHRRLVARHWTHPPARKPGRPPIDTELRRPIVRTARENPTWGYRRVHGELCRLGHSIAASSVWNILRRAGIDPTRYRTGPTWGEFIRSQAAAVTATDFALCRHGPTAPVPRHVRDRDRHPPRAPGRHHRQPDQTVDHPNRPQPPHAMERRSRFPEPVIRDGAGQFTASFDTVLTGPGITGPRIPPRSPRATRTHNDGSERCDTNCSTAPSSGTSVVHRRHRVHPSRPTDRTTHRLRRTHQRIPHRSLTTSSPRPDPNHRPAGSGANPQRHSPTSP